jgi:rhamnosyltransferase
MSIAPETFNHGATRDQGIAAATCDSVILMVQDALPYDDRLIAYLIAPLSDSAVAGAYARQIPRPQADIITKRNLETWLTGRATREVRSIADLEAYDGLSPLQKYHFCNFDNVCSVIRKSAWQQEHFGIANFGEDIAWAERVMKRGHKIVYEPAAGVIHSHDRSMRYDYQRTYVCHRMLYRQFGLAQVETALAALLAWVRVTVSDVLYIAMARTRLMEKLKALMHAPFANAFRILGQYHAVRDERHGRPSRVVGV